jgi:hypothetical protein
VGELWPLVQAVVRAGAADRTGCGADEVNRWGGEDCLSEGRREEDGGVDCLPEGRSWCRREGGGGRSGVGEEDGDFTMSGWISSRARPPTRPKIFFSHSAQNRERQKQNSAREKDSDNVPKTYLEYVLGTRVSYVRIW